MSKKIIFAFLLFISFSSSIHAQLEKTIHQTFDVSKSNAISLELISDTILVVPWAGNNILTETKVELYEASPSIMAHFVEKEKRYAIEADTTSGSYRLFSTDQERKPIRTRQGECPEIVQIRVFVPEDFEKQSNTNLVRTN